MPRNKYQRRRGMRPSTTAASAAQTELIQGAVQQPHSSTSSTDVGREAARQLRERSNPNTMFIDKPDATSNKNVLRDAYNRQQAASRSVQRQVLGEASTASLKPSGRYSAPSVPPRTTMQLVAKGGAIRLMPVPAMGANIAAGVAAYAIEQAAQPALEYLGEKLAKGLYAGKEFLFGDDDGVTFDEWQKIFNTVKQDVQMKRQQGQEPTPDYVQGEIERLRQQIANINKPTPRFGRGRESLLDQFSDAQMLQLSQAPTLEQKDELLTQFKAQNLEAQESKRELSATKPIQEEPVVEEVPTEYQIRRAALGSNPTKEEIAAVLAYGLEQHRINFPHLYEPKTPNPLMS